MKPINKILPRRPARLFTGLASVILILLLLAGCGGEEDRSFLMAAPPASDRMLAQAAPVETEAEDTPATDTAVSLSVLAPNLTGTYTGDESGCYRVYTFTDASADIHYTSYESMTTVRLDGPPKITELQMGQVLGTNGGASPVLFGGNLFLFQMGGASGLNDDDGQPVAAILQRLDTDGQNPVRLTFPARYSFLSESAVVTDGAALYFFMADSQDTASVLMRLDPVAMEYVEMHRMPQGLDYNIVGVWQMGLVVSAADTLPAADDAAFTEAWANRSYALYRMGLATGGVTQLFSWQQGLSWAAYQNCFYYWSDETASLSGLNADTGESFNAAEGFSPAGYERVQLQSLVVDGKLRVLVSSSGPAATYVVDLSTGAWEEAHYPQTSTEDGEAGTAMIICAETSGYFLVQTGDRWAHRSTIEPEFETQASYNDNYAKVPIYGLILKADYWAGNSSVLPIEDLVYE